SSKMLAGEVPTIFGTGDQTRDYVFVDDVVHGFSLAAERGSGHLINIGTGVEASVNELYRTLSDLTKFGLEPEFGPLREGEVLRSALGPNMWLIDECYRRYREDPDSVGAAWKEFFEGFSPKLGAEPSGDGSARTAEPGAPPPAPEPAPAAPAPAKSPEPAATA